MNEDNGYDATIQMPEGASTLAPQVDALFYDIYWISVVFFVAIVGAMCVFAYRFRRQKGVKSKPPGHHNALELFWTFSPLILLAYMFHQGFDGYMNMAIAPESSINIRVRASQWTWEFEQPNGMVDSRLTVPIHQPVRMIMASVPNGPTAEEPNPMAVIHSFFVPAFRVKRDIVPGMYTSLWFEATRLGEYTVYCAEYCGLNHSAMLSTVEVVTAERYAAFLQDGPQCPEDIAEDWQWGEQVFATNGCPGCHVTDAALPFTVGPNLANVAGTMQPLEGGTEHMADTDYFRRSLAEPQAEVVRTFTSAAMPAVNLPESKLNALIAYLAHISDSGSSIEWDAQCGEAGAARRAAEAEGE